MSFSIVPLLKQMAAPLPGSAVLSHSPRALRFCLTAPGLCLRLEKWVLSPLGAASPLLGAAPVQPGHCPCCLWVL